MWRKEKSGSNWRDRDTYCEREWETVCERECVSICTCAYVNERVREEKGIDKIKERSYVAWNRNVQCGHYEMTTMGVWCCHQLSLGNIKKILLLDFSFYYIFITQIFLIIVILYAISNIPPKTKAVIKTLLPFNCYKIYAHVK